MCVHLRGSLAHCSLAPGTVPDALQRLALTDSTVEVSVLVFMTHKKKLGVPEPDSSLESVQRFRPEAGLHDCCRSGPVERRMSSSPAADCSCWTGIAVCRDRPPALGQRLGRPVPSFLASLSPSPAHPPL